MGAERYESLRRIVGWDQDRVRQTTAMVVGVGALGNEVLKNLALLGVGRIVLVDFDTVSGSNLSRSVLFRSSDEGQPKGATAARAVREINPDVQVLPINADATREVGLGVYRRMHLVFGCVDSVAARFHLNRRCWMVGVPWVEGGISDRIGTVKTFRPPDSACYECTLSAEDRAALSPKRSSCSDAPLLSARPSASATPMIASITGAIMVQQGITMLFGEEEGGRGWVINSASGEATRVKFSRRVDCFAHDRQINKEIIVNHAWTAATKLGPLLEMASTVIGSSVELELGRSVVSELKCSACDESETVWLDRDALVQHKLRCSRCGRLRTPQYIQKLGQDARFVDRSLTELKIPPLDILALRDENEIHFLEIGDENEVLFE